MKKILNIQEVMNMQKTDKDLFETAKNFAFDYLQKTSEREVFPTETAIKGLETLEESLPDSPCDPYRILNILQEYGSPATVATSGGRYFGFVNGSLFPSVIAAKWMADVWDQNAALYVMSPISSKLESMCEKWIVSLLGLPENTVAGFVSGSSTATICGLTAARNELLKKKGWDVNSKGLFGAPEIKVVLGEHAHSSVFKGLAIIGLGKDRVYKVPVDSQGRMIADKLPELDETTIVIAQAGNVNSGSFDPFDKICDKAQKAGAWLHIDGAFGLWAAASESKKYLTKGIEKADSWSVDAHKTLNAPYDCGIILCRHKEALIGAMQATGSYIQYSENRDGMLYNPEMSRRARSIELWATIKALGKSGIEELIDGLCSRANEFAEKLKRAGFHILNDIVFNQVLVACETQEQTKKTLENIQKSGECWCGGAIWNNELVIRISIYSWATTSNDIDRALVAFIASRKD